MAPYASRFQARSQPPVCNHGSLVHQIPEPVSPGGPPPLTSDEYAADFNEVKTWGSAIGSPRTLDQTLLAIFWAGNTPAFWNRIASSVMDNHPRLTLIRKARVFALLNIAMADAAIACWDAKYYYQFWRPITAITLADLDGNRDTDVDSSWTPLLGGYSLSPRICFRALHCQRVGRFGAHPFFRRQHRLPD